MIKIDGATKVREAYSVQGSSTTVQPKQKVQMQKDTIALSEVAKDYVFALNAIKSVPNVRQDLVQKLEKEVSSGNYNVSGMQILEKAQESVLDIRM
jgi:negative regulator of flagellin synthesis FlgM